LDVPRKKTLTAFFHTIDALVAAIFTLVLAVIRATVGAFTNPVTAPFPKLAAPDNLAALLRHYLDPSPSGSEQFDYLTRRI
jgi:hypothetical protein